MWTKWKLARLILSSKSFFIHSLKTFITVQCSFFPVQSGAKKWNQIFSFILFSIYLIFQVKRVNFSAPSPRKMGSWSHYSAGGFTCQIGFSVQSWMDLVYVFQLGWKMLEEETFYKSEVHEAVKAKNAVMISHDVVK